MNFGELKADLLASIGRAPSGLCYTMTTAEINQKLRLRSMLSTTTLTEATSISLPSDFLEVEHAYLNTNPPRSLRASSNQLLRFYGNDQGLPTEYAIQNGAMLLDRVSGGGEQIELSYYAQFADLSADSDTNVVLETYPAIYVFGVLAQHAALVRDEAALRVHFPAFERAMQDAMSDDIRKKMGGRSQAVKVGATP